MIRLFCQATREFFQVDGTYYWELTAAGELIGIEADGHLATHFRGHHLKATEKAVTNEAVVNRRTVLANHVDPSQYPLVAEFSAKSVMVAPLVVAKEIIGAGVFLHETDDNFFDEDMAAKATILAGQLGSLLEAARWSDKSREEHRRAEILAEVAQSLYAVPDSTSVVAALADRLRTLLRSPLVCILLRTGESFHLRGCGRGIARLGSFSALPL